VPNARRARWVRFRSAFNARSSLYRVKSAVLGSVAREVINAHHRPVVLV
jgi:nucleotide-binding universal stress UspA family protein